LVFLIGMRGKSALFDREQMGCHTTMTMVAYSLTVQLFRHSLPVLDTLLKSSFVRQAEHHSLVMMLVRLAWAAEDIAWVNAGTLFSADLDACNTRVVPIFANAESVHILRVITLPLRRMALRMVDEVGTTMEATITFSRHGSMSIIFPITLVQVLEMMAVDNSTQMDADSTVINLPAEILLMMIPTTDMEGMTVEMADQMDLTGQADQGFQGGPTATELVPGADANVDVDFVFLMTAYLATAGITEHLLFQTAFLQHNMATLQMR
jgi:hypothetical protein